MPTATDSFQLTVETLLSAQCGRETLLVRYDTQSRRGAELAIDEHDNGTLIAFSGGIEILDALCKALHRPPLRDEHEQLLTTIGESDTGSATLVETVHGYVLRLNALGERERCAHFSREDGATLRRAIRGSFQLWH